MTYQSRVLSHLGQRPSVLIKVSEMVIHMPSFTSREITIFLWVFAGSSVHIISEADSLIMF